MRSPTRRIWAYSVDAKTVEIIILGDPEDIAPMFAKVTAAIRAWVGFERTDPIVMQPPGAQLGIRACLSANATYDDAVAEALLAIEAGVGKRVIDWHVGLRRTGDVGTW